MNGIVCALWVLLLLLVAASAVYQLLCLRSAAHFFRAAPPAPDFTPPVSVLKPLRGAEEWAYRALASFCDQDYPDYEIVFGVRDARDPAVAMVERLRAEFPRSNIKLVADSSRVGTSAKVSNLHNICREARHDILVVSDADARVGRDYLRAVVAPLADAKVGLVTCLYRPAGATNFSALMEGLGLTGEFAPGVLVARWMEGVRFAFGATAVIRRRVLDEFGAFAAIANRLGDDFLLGNLTARRGHEVVLSRHVVETVIPPYRFGEMFRHQLRWARSTKFRRPRGHVGLLFTFTTALSLAALAAFPASRPVWLVSGVALILRFAAAWLIGVRGFGDEVLRRYFYLLPARDVLSFVVWVVSFCGNTVVWCGDRYRLAKGGYLVPLKK
jgi:ceramide glucosyltransferase